MLVAGSHKRTMNLEKFNKKLGEKLVVVPAYNSREWPRARFPRESQEIIVPQTKETAYTDLIVQLSCNEITNIQHIQDAKLRFHLAEKSTFNTVAVAASKNTRSFRMF